MNKEKTNRLNGKDLINIGIFTAVYFILNLLIAAAMGFIPIVNMMIPFVSSLVLGIPMMLYFSKIKKFGMVLITYIIYGVILTLAGVGFYSLIGGTLCAVAAEFILKAKHHKSVFAAILSYAIWQRRGKRQCTQFCPYDGSAIWQKRLHTMGRNTWILCRVTFLTVIRYHWWPFLLLLVA